MIDFAGIGAALASCPGSVVRAQTMGGDILMIQSRMRAQQAAYQQREASFAAQSQYINSLAQLAGMQASAAVALAVSEAEIKARTKSRLISQSRLRQLERKFMAKTRDGYRARRRVERAFWYVGALIVGGGVVLPIAMKLYTMFWTWALT